MENRIIFTLTSKHIFHCPDFGVPYNRQSTAKSHWNLVGFSADNQWTDLDFNSWYFASESVGIEENVSINNKNRDFSVHTNDFTSRFWKRSQLEPADWMTTRKMESKCEDWHAEARCYNRSQPGDRPSPALVRAGVARCNRQQFEDNNAATALCSAVSL